MRLRAFFLMLLSLGASEYATLTYTSVPHVVQIWSYILVGIGLGTWAGRDQVRRRD